MKDEFGVPDETYAALFDTFLSGAVEAAAFRSQFYATMTSDARLGTASATRSSSASSSVSTIAC